MSPLNSPRPPEVRRVPVWGWMLLGIPAIAVAFWLDARLGLVTLEAIPIVGGGLALYKVIRTAEAPLTDPDAGSQTGMRSAPGVSNDIRHKRPLAPSPRPAAT